MSDIVCNSAGCQSGRALVAQMWSVYRSLPNDYPNFDAVSFQSAADAIQASLDANTHWYEALIPFNSACCAIQDIGAQAQLLTRQMLASVGAADVPAPPSEAGLSWLTIAALAGAVLLAVVYSPQIKGALK